MAQTPVRALLTLVSTFCFLALAIAGAGGPARFFAPPSRVVVVAAFFAFAVAALFTRGNLSTGLREDRGNRWVIGAFALIGLLSAFLPAYAEREGFWVIDGDAVRWLGAVLLAVGGVLRLAPVFILGPRFSGLVAIQPDHRLETGGLYGVIRHPSYLGLLVMMFGWALVFRSGVGLLLWTLFFPPLLARIAAEERLLESHFGDQYRAYRARTARLVPFVY
jgi:protein-S-isoprenylcysteine O-methyltransferase Ste14